MSRNVGTNYNMLPASTPQVPSPEIISSEAPKWLDILENRRKRPHRLAHEIGAGSPCLVCKEKCKGLNLHFWRKICTECKCRKEDHDVLDDEEYVQFEILFGAKRVKKTTMKYNAHNKTFDWVPQNAPQELVLDYLNAIPESKLPITNSEGAIYRKQQLEKQLPVHDVNPHACHNLTDKEVTEFGKYLENLRNNVIGQGKIMKFKHCNFVKDIYTPCTSSTSFVPKVTAELGKSHGTGVDAQLVCDNDPHTKTVYSEIINVEAYPAGCTARIDYINHNTSNLRFPLNSEQLRTNISGHISHSDSSGVQFPSLAGKLQNLTFSDSLTSPSQQHNVVSENDNISGTGKPSSTIKIRGSFLKGREPIYDSQNNFAGLSLNDNEEAVTSDSDKNRAEAENISCILPINMNKEVAISDFDNETPKLKKEPCNVNIMNASSCELPFTPLQETRAISRGKEVLEKDYILKEDKPFNGSDKVPLRTGNQKCLQCRETFTQNDIVVRADRGGDSALWHAGCFVCHICQELLVDLMYFYHEGKVYCGRDYARVRNIPRCFACDELIFVKEYTQAEGESYHIKHFCCYHCDEPLAGKQYISKDNQPVCLACYQTHYGKTCNTCLKQIPVSEQRISVGELHFHLSATCFRCKSCFKFLKGERFFLRNGEAFCSKECFQQFKN